MTQRQTPYIFIKQFFWFGWSGFKFLGNNTTLIPYAISIFHPSEQQWDAQTGQSYHREVRGYWKGFTIERWVVGGRLVWGRWVWGRWIGGRGGLEGGGLEGEVGWRERWIGGRGGLEGGRGGLEGDAGFHLMVGVPPCIVLLLRSGSCRLLCVWSMLSIWVCCLAVLVCLTVLVSLLVTIGSRNLTPCVGKDVQLLEYTVLFIYRQFASIARKVPKFMVLKQ